MGHFFIYLLPFSSSLFYNYFIAAQRNFNMNQEIFNFGLLGYLFYIPSNYLFYFISFFISLGFYRCVHLYCSKKFPKTNHYYEEHFSFCMNFSPIILLICGLYGFGFYCFFSFFIDYQIKSD